MIKGNKRSALVDTQKRLVRNPLTWVDARGQVVYIKGSRKNKTERLTAAELEATKDFLSGTVTRADGKVFYAPFHIRRTT